MKISPVYFSDATPLLGRRMVDLSELEDLQDQISGFVKSTECVRDSTLINLAGPIETDLTNFLRLARAKGRQFCRIVETVKLGIFPDWLQALDTVVLSFVQPKHLENARDFNDAIQQLWFARQEVMISCRVQTDQDLAIVELLYSYTPNDIPFFIEIDHPCTIIQRQWLLRELSHDRFATARVVELEADQT